MTTFDRVRYLSEFFPEFVEDHPGIPLRLASFHSSQDNTAAKRARTLGKGAEVTLMAVTDAGIRHCQLRVTVLDRDPSWDEPIGRPILYLGSYKGKEGLVFSPEHVMEVITPGFNTLECPALEPTSRPGRRQNRYSIQPLESGLGSSIVDSSGEVQLIVPEDSSLAAPELCVLLNSAARLHGA